MSSARNRWDRLFAPFEGTREPTMVAVFRILFFTGLIVHFFPALLRLDEAFARDGLRTQEWSRWLYVHFTRLPRGLLRAGAIVTMLGCVMGLVGLRPRLAAAIAFAGLYAFSSFNGLPVHTLAIVDAWGILLLFILCGGGSGALSVDALLRRGRKDEPRLLPALVLYQTLLAVFFAGIEKVRAGWLTTNEMGVLLSYPKGMLLRDWVVAAGWLHAPFVTRALTLMTLLIELGTPVALLLRKTRWPALLAYQAFFLGIVAMLEVPPLFYFMFAGGALLVLEPPSRPTPAS
jgi:hypothetical protein